MTLNDRQKIGLAILGAIGVALLVWYFLLRPNPDPCCDPPDLEQITVVGYGGNIKVPFLENPEVAAILREKYGLTIEVDAMDTVEMLCEAPLEGIDFLWAGDQSQIQTYEECRNRSDFSRNLVLTPLVIYSWTNSTQALVDQGIAEVGEDGVYRVDMLSLIALIESGQSWNDIGLEDRPSPIIVEPTDPNQSTSGQLFSGLLVNTMNCLEVTNLTTIEPILPGYHDYIQRLGFITPASAELFRLYISQGEGAYPLVALLESQIVETVLANPDIVATVEDEIRILYPEPTVWLTHPMISLTDGGRRLVEAMLDPEIQALGWALNGFRPSVPGVQIDLSILPIPGVASRIDSVIDIPSTEVMDRVLDAARAEYVADPNAPSPPGCSSEGEKQATPVAVHPD